MQPAGSLLVERVFHGLYLALSQLQRFAAWISTDRLLSRFSEGLADFSCQRSLTVGDGGPEEPA